MASVKISELKKFTPIDLGNGENLLIPASKGSDTTKTINVKELVDHVVANSTHEQEQQTRLNGHDSELASHTNTLQSHTTKLQSHTNTLQSHTNELKELDNTIQSHTSELQEHDNTIQSHTSELQELDNTIQTHTSELETHETKISNVENINVWDLTTFH